MSDGASPELLAAIAATPGAQASYDRLPLSHRREYDKWVSQAPTPAARARRAAQAVERFLD